MKRSVLLFAIVGVMLMGAVLAGCAGTDSGSSAIDPAGQVFPAGRMVIYGYGQPQYRMEYYNNWLERNRDIAPEVTIETVQTEGEADARQKTVIAYASGAYDEMPDVVQTAPVSMIDMAEGGILMDLTDFLTPMADQFVDGALEQLVYNDRLYALPDSIRPQLLFYNQEIFDQYDIDPDEMDTVAGYLEVGRKLREASNGEVYLSYIDPGSLTWRYYGRRGFMPQAEARIWDEDGNVVIDTDPGALLAFQTIATLYNEGMVLNSAIMQPPLYDATRNGQVATYYIGAFWDEFLRANVSEMEGKWRVRPAPVYEDINKRGAPVAGMYAITNKPDAPYAELYQKLWYDFHFDAPERETWTESMVSQNAPFSNPITRSLLADPYWQEPSSFYGGQSFRQMEGIGLENSAENMRITSADAEADIIISVEVERFVAGDQTMEEAIANMGRNLRDRIGTTDPE